MDAPPYLRRLSRTCGVLVLVAVVFAPWQGRDSGGIYFSENEFSWFAVFRERLAEIRSRGFELPGRALDPSSSEQVQEHAIWSIQAPLVVALLGSIPASGAFLVLALRRKRSRRPLLATIGGTAAGSALLLRAVSSNGGWHQFERTELGSWILASVPLALGAIAVLGALQRHRRTPMAIAALCSIAGLSAFLPGHRVPVIFWGARAATLLLALAVVLESARAFPLIRPDPQEGEPLPPAWTLPARWRRIANRASFVVLVLSIAFAGILLRRATRPERLNDSYDDWWPLFMDVNQPVRGDPIQEVAFLGKGDVLATVRHPGDMQLWSVSDGSLRRTFSVDERPARAISPNGDLVASGRGGIRVSTASDGRVVWRAPQTGWALGFSPRGDILAAAVFRNIQLLSATTGTLVRELEGDCFAFSPDGELVATGRGPWPEAVQIRSLRDGSLLRELEGAYSIDTLAFSEGGDLVLGTKGSSASGATQGPLYVWSAKTGQLLRKIIPPLGTTLGPWSPDGTRMVVRIGDNAFIGRVSSLDPWQPVLGKMVFATQGPIAWSPHDDLLAVGVGSTVRFVPIPKAAPEDRSLVAPAGSR